MEDLTRARRNEWMQARVVQGRLVISIGIETLAHAANLSPAFEGDDDFGEDPPKYRVDNPDVFAEEVALALQHEEEDGSTPLHRLLDEAFRQATDDGCDGVDYEPSENAPADAGEGGRP